MAPEYPILRRYRLRPLEDLAPEPAAAFRNSDVLELGFTEAALLRFGSNAQASGNFLTGTVDEIGHVHGEVTDETLFDAYKKMSR